MSLLADSVTLTHTLQLSSFTLFPRTEVSTGEIQLDPADTCSRGDFGGHMLLTPINVLFHIS